MIIDLHADTPLWQQAVGYNLCLEHRAWLPGGAWGGHVDVPRMRRVGMAAQIFGLVSLPWAPHGYQTIGAMIQGLEHAAKASAGAFALVRSASDLQTAYQQGACAGLLSLEGVHSLKGDLRRADALIQQGVVSFGLAHFSANAACRPAYGWGASSQEGLTPWGRKLVQYLADQRVIVDLAHINLAGFWDTLASSPGPVMVSHTGMYGAHAHWRNLHDGPARAVADRGGVIGIIFSRRYLGGSDISAVVRHMVHLLKVGGTECVALGSDFDGMVVPVKGLRDVTGLPQLREVMSRQGIPASKLDKIMGDNALRFLREALG